MKLTKSFEQGISIMAVIATQKDDVPVSSRTLQQCLGSSVSYTQKIMRKLVVAKLVESISGNSGGFVLARPVDQISVLDIVEALEGKVDSFPDSGLISKTFKKLGQDEVNVTSADEAIHRIFATADGTWSEVLRNISVADIVSRVISSGVELPEIDWNNNAVEAERMQHA